MTLLLVPLQKMALQWTRFDTWMSLPAPIASSPSELQSRRLWKGLGVGLCTSKDWRHLKFLLCFFLMRSTCLTICSPKELLLEELRWSLSNISSLLMTVPRSGHLSCCFSALNRSEMYRSGKEWLRERLRLKSLSEGVFMDSNYSLTCQFIQPPCDSSQQSREDPKSQQRINVT